MYLTASLTFATLALASGTWVGHGACTTINSRRQTTSNAGASINGTPSGIVHNTRVSRIRRRSATCGVGTNEGLYARYTPTSQRNTPPLATIVEDRSQEHVREHLFEPSPLRVSPSGLQRRLSLRCSEHRLLIPTEGFFPRIVE